MDDVLQVSIEDLVVLLYWLLIYNRCKNKILS